MAHTTSAPQRTITGMGLDDLRDWVWARFAQIGRHNCSICRTACPPFAGNGAPATPWVCSSCEWNYVYAGGNVATLRLAWRGYR